MAPAPQTQGEKPATLPVILWENYTSFLSSEKLALGLLFNPLTRKCLLTPWCSETSAFKYTRQRIHTILFPEYFCWVPKQCTYRLGCSWSSGRCKLSLGFDSRCWPCVTQTFLTRRMFLPGQVVAFHTLCTSKFLLSTSQPSIFTVTRDGAGSWCCLLPTTFIWSKSFNQKISHYGAYMG